MARVKGADDVSDAFELVSEHVLSDTRRSFGQMNGSTKFAVPIWTAEAPAIMNSRASRASAMPPIPMIGIFTACRHSYTIRTAIGRIAGPLNPPRIFEIRAGGSRRR